jgi:hypothetical protein
VGVTTGTVTIAGVIGSPVNLTGTAQAATFTASVSPSPLAFGSWAIGTTSSTLNVTVTNTGNSGLAGLTYTFGGTSGTTAPANVQPFSRVTTGTFPAGAPNCAAALAVGASCTVKVQFAPPNNAVDAVAFSRTLTVAGTGATIAPTPVSLTGTGVANRATLQIVPNPLNIVLPTGTGSGVGVVTLTNTAPLVGGAQVLVTSAVGAPTNLNFSIITGALLAGPDTCTGATLAPQASCDVTVRFTNLFGARNTLRNGTVTFTDNGAASPQVGNVTGFATP